MSKAEDFPKFQGVIQPRGFPGLPDDWESEWETFQSSDGKLQLFGALHHEKNWKRSSALVVVHGLGEHGGRYLHFPQFLKDVVGAVYMIDMRGHGRSEGLRGHVDRFDLYAEDVALAIRRLDEKLKARFGSSEIHVLGHSLGGLILLRTLFKFTDLPIYSATISAPLLGVRAKVPAIKKAAGQILSRLWGSLHMDSELEVAHLSHDQEVVDAYTADRLVHSKVTPKFYTEMLAAVADTNSRKSGVPYALQVVVPLEDQLADPEAAVKFYQALSHKDKRLRTYNSFFHESFNEIGKEKAFEDLTSWIKAHRG